MSNVRNFKSTFSRNVFEQNVAFQQQKFVIVFAEKTMKMCTPASRYQVLRYESSSFPGSPKSRVVTFQAESFSFHLQARMTKVLCSYCVFVRNLNLRTKALLESQLRVGTNKAK